MSTASKMNNIDLQLTTFTKSDWVGELLVGNTTIDNDGEKEESTTIDICRYLPGGQNHNDINSSMTKLRFDASIFPPSENHDAAFASSNPTYIKLRKELQRAAIQCGYSIVPKSGARFVCKCGRTYANGTKKKSPTGVDATILGKGPNGKNLHRNTTTSLPMHADETCKFAVKLYHDSKGYYVSPRHGNAIHSNHPSSRAAIKVDVRSTLTPLIDQICSLYENKNAKHRDMPSINNVVNAMNETIRDVSSFFHGLDESNKQSNKRKTIH